MVQHASSSNILQQGRGRVGMGGASHSGSETHPPSTTSTGRGHEQPTMSNGILITLLPPVSSVRQPSTSTLSYAEIKPQNMFSSDPQWGLSLKSIGQAHGKALWETRLNHPLPVCP